MTLPWKEVLDELELSMDPTEAPLDHGGDWHQALAEFRKLGFARLLVGTPHSIALHCGHPEINAELVKPAAVRLESRAGCSWSTDEVDGTWWLISGEIEEEKRRSSLVTVLRLAEDLRDDDPDWSWLLEDAQETEDTTQESEQDGGESDDPESDDDADESAAADGSPFESIGDEENETSTEADASESEESSVRSVSDGFSFAIETDDDSLVVAFVFASTISSDRDEIEEAVTRNFRAKFDVSVDVPGADKMRGLGFPYPRCVLFRLTPTSLTDEAPPGLEECEQGVGEYLETIESLAQGGIDPLVFLGVRASNRGVSPPEDKMDESRDDAEPVGEDTSVESDDSGDEVFFLIEDDEGADEIEDGDAVVLASVDIADDAPLTAGRFDDPRLDEPDAGTSLVDVVLRHPGYSDRRVGQVLSILFSIEYYEALRLMNAAPIVVARAVSQERGNTIQNVVDGAGGRVKLTEPDRFPVSE